MLASMLVQISFPRTETAPPSFMASVVRHRDARELQQLGAHDEAAARHCSGVDLEAHGAPLHDEPDHPALAREDLDLSDGEHRLARHRLQNPGRSEGLVAADEHDLAAGRFQRAGDAPGDEAPATDALARPDPFDPATQRVIARNTDLERLTP